MNHPCALPCCLLHMRAAVPLCMVLWYSIGPVFILRVHRFSFFLIINLVMPIIYLLKTSSLCWSWMSIDPVALHTTKSLSCAWCAAVMKLWKEHASNWAFEKTTRICAESHTRNQYQTAKWPGVNGSWRTGKDLVSGTGAGTSLVDRQERSTKTPWYH